MREKRALLIYTVLMFAAVFVAILLSDVTARAATCPQSGAVMGCSVGAQPVPTPPPPKIVYIVPYKGCVFPDVSSYQGHPDWVLAKKQICAAVVKAGQATDTYPDSDFVWNVQQLQALAIPWSAYWFIQGCGDGPAFVRALNSVGFKNNHDALRPVLDMEVPAAAGCAVPTALAIYDAFGVWPVIYTAPGTWPGGSSGGLDVWEADYTYGYISPLPFHAVVVAWQRYSPPYTAYYLYGLGWVDVSINTGGYATDFAYPKVAKPVPNAMRYQNYNTATWVLGGVKLTERGTVESWDKSRCRNPVLRSVCVTDRKHLVLLRNRLLSLHAKGQPWWYGSPSSIGDRNQQLYQRLHATKPLTSWSQGL